MKCLGSDLLVGCVESGDALAAALSAELGVEAANVYQVKQFTWEQSPAPHDASGAYISALGKKDTVLIRELTGQGEIGFIVEIEFLKPIPLAALQRLSDVHGLFVGLSRDTAFPQESGTLTAEQFVLFRPEAAPHFATVLESQLNAQQIIWGVLNQPLPELPEELLPRES